jgi:ABC-type sugar transport system ATPase subunit
MEKVETLSHKAKINIDVTHKEDKEDGKCIVGIRKDKFKLSKKKNNAILIETNWSQDLEVKYYIV